MATEPKSNLIVLSEQEGAAQFARDINHKMDTMDAHFDRLTDLFSHSQSVFQSSMEDLQSKTTALAGDIQQLSEHMSTGFAHHAEATTQLEANLQALQATHEEKFRRTDEALSTHILETQANLGQQSDALDQLKAQQRLFGDLQNRLDELSQAQGIEIEALGKRTRERFTRNESQLSAITALLEGHKVNLGELFDSYQRVQARTDALSDSLTMQADQLATHETHTRTRFTRFGWATGAMLACVVGGIVALQYYPLTLPGMLQEKFDQLTLGQTTQAERTLALGASLDSLQGAVGASQATTTQLSGDLAMLDQSVQAGNRARGDLQRTQEQTNAQLTQVTGNIASLQKTVDDLDFQIKGPGVGSEVTLTGAVPLNDGDYLNTLPADHYTIQLLGVYREAHLFSFINRNETALSGQAIAYNVSQRIGKDWYNLYLGNYPSFDAAQSALDDLPLRLKGNNPWIRQIGAVQKTAVR